MGHEPAAANPEELNGSVLIIEDHAVLAQGLALVLAREGHRVHTLAADEVADEAVVAEALGRTSADVVLLDLHLGPAGDSRVLIPVLRDRGARVLVLTGEEDPAELGECLEAGAAAVIAKSTPLEEVVAAVSRAIGGQRVMALPGREEMLAAAQRRRSQLHERLGPFAALTPREEEVLAALVAGHSAQEVAQDLYVSLPTVRTQIRSIFQKLGVNTQLQAVVMARDSGWRPRH